MSQVSQEYKAVLSRIPEIVENLIQSDRLFLELDKYKMIQIVSRSLEKYLSPEQLLDIEEDELTRRIDRLLAIEVMSRLLDGLSPEQIEMFYAAVEGRE